MWKPREEPPRSTGTSPITTASAPPSYVPVTGTGSSDFDRTEKSERMEKKEQKAMRDEQVTIGKSILIKGELSGDEDLTIEGQVEGKIELREHVLTIGPNGRIKAEVYAKAIVVLGQVTGNLLATEKVTIRERGSVEGDIVAPGVAIADGAYFKGSVDMQRKELPAPAAATAHWVDGKASVPVGKPQVAELASV
jgi:cytoskeletal protein CcmA (bactofilin family)